MLLIDGLDNTYWNFYNKSIVRFTLVKIVLILMSEDILNLNADPNIFENQYN